MSGSLSNVEQQCSYVRRKGFVLLLFGCCSLSVLHNENTSSFIVYCQDQATSANAVKCLSAAVKLPVANISSIWELKFQRIVVLILILTLTYSRLVRLVKCSCQHTKSQWLVGGLFSFSWHWDTEPDLRIWKKPAGFYIRLFTACFLSAWVKHKLF